jgi:hypothetical protein
MSATGGQGGQGGQGAEEPRQTINIDEDTTEWSSGLEEVLRKEGEESESLFWLHNKSATLANRYNDVINIPSIVLQTVTGFLSATSGLVPPLVLGSVSVFTGILSTLLSYYKFSAKAEGHKMCAQLYHKIFKNLEIELSLPPDQRMRPMKLLEDVRNELARVGEVAPDIPEHVIGLYKKEFTGGDTKKPVIASGLDKIMVFSSTPPVPKATTLLVPKPAPAPAKAVIKVLV